MRTLLAVTLTVAVACSSSMGKGVKKLGSGLGKLGSGVATVAGRVVPRGSVEAPVMDVGMAQVQDRVAAIEPVTIHRTVGSTSAPAAVAPAPTPTVTTTHRTVDTRLPVWKVYRQGDKHWCEKYAGDERTCTSECTDLMRSESMRQLDPKAGPAKSCSCSEASSCE